MLISYKNTKLEKEFCDLKLLKRRWGDRQGYLIAQRLDQIRAADNLAVLARLPQLRVHELKGNRKGQISIDVRQPYRLLIVPDHEEMPLKEDGGLDWPKVTKIKVLGVEDIHD
ncbi:MAG: type II toxin-antitoxin system RelE/ParE family toxin [Thermodesulfobacteriota bacterium]